MILSPAIGMAEKGAKSREKRKNMYRRIDRRLGFLCILPKLLFLRLLRFFAAIN
jgi:hypothetical protein